ncbi:hypothetical protein EI613_27450 [Azospirillum sp. 412522]|nr:hypothetical protein [Azospirillum sp. 412522]
MNAQPIRDFSPSPPRGEGRGEGDARRTFPRILATRPPHPNPLPAFGGPLVRLSRQGKLRLRVSGGERGSWAEVAR